MQGPPLELHAELTDVNGVRTRLDANDPDPGKRPDGISYTTQRMGGFGIGSLTLHRHALREHVDLNLLDHIALIGADGSIAYEGRVTALPRSIQDTHQITIQAAGHIAHASDRRFRQVYVERDITRFGPMARQRHLNVVTASSYTIAEATVEPGGTPALTMKFNLDGKKNLVEAWYDAGPDIQIARIHFDYDGVNLGTVDGGDANWGAYVVAADDDIRTNTWATSNLLQTDTSGSGYHTPDEPQRYVELEFFHSGTASASPTSERVFNWRKVALYGNHGLTLYPIDDEPDGVTASDVIRHIVANYCPQLDPAGVIDTTYPIAHLAFTDRVTPYEAFLQVNSFHRWNLAVWENRTLHFSPVDMTDYAWQVRTDDPGVTIDLQGDSADTLVNGIVVTYTDLTTRRQTVLTPADYAELRDPDPSNPATLHGLEKWHEVTLSNPALERDALQMGRALLAEFTAPTAPGTITIRGHLRDRAGHLQQPWKPRAGETIAIVDHPNDRPRLITETSYNHESRSVTITVEGQPRRMDAIMDRHATALAAAGLAAS